MVIINSFQGIHPLQSKLVSFRIPCCPFREGIPTHQQGKKDYTGDNRLQLDHCIGSIQASHILGDPFLLSKTFHFDHNSLGSGWDIWDQLGYMCQASGILQHLLHRDIASYLHHIPLRALGNWLDSWDLWLYRSLTFYIPWGQHLQGTTFHHLNSVLDSEMDNPLKPQNQQDPNMNAFWTAI